MKVWTSLEGYERDPSRPLVLALGNFDGLHVGHQRIVKSVVDRARERQGTAAVLTFYEHPQRILHQCAEPALLTSPQHRLFLFQEMGVEICFVPHFTLPFSKTDPEIFVEEWLMKRLGVEEVHLGYNAHFGFNRRGDSSLMRVLSRRLGFGFCEAEAVKIEGEFVSSTLIREFVRRGELARAEKFLGRAFSIFTTVVRGEGRGRSLGFPTANLRLHSEIMPPRGVYLVEARENCYHLKALGREGEFEFVEERCGPWWTGILNFGRRPTFEPDREQSIPEVHLLDFEGNLYGRTLEVVFRQRIRDEKVFASSSDLVQAIEQDVVNARRYFSGTR